MPGWSLAIDFGTTFTAAATATDGAAPEPVEIDGSRSLPSVVCLDDDGQILTGRAAASQANVFPERAERLPKRALAAGDTVRLGGRDTSTVELVAAVLARIAREATRRFDGQAPATVVLTHPAGWGQREITRLGQAAAHAGLPAPHFLPEPVAAAVYYTAAATETGVPLDGHAAVYDLGGGTFDAAVLRRTAEGYEVRGTGGDPHFGGEDIDTLLLDLVAEQLPTDARDAWDELWAGDGRRARRAQTKIREEIVRAKHELSERPTHTVYVDEYLDGVDDGIRVTRAELDEAIAQPLADTTTELLRTIHTAGLDLAALSSVYLTGGATRTPRVSTAVTTALGRLPSTSGDPKLVVALGALTTPPAASRSRARTADGDAGADSDGRGRRRRDSGTRQATADAAPWTAKLGVRPRSQISFGLTIHPAIVDGDRVYAQEENGVAAFDARSGQLAWRTRLSGGSKDLLCLTSDLVVAVFGGGYSSPDTVQAVDKDSGAEIWRTSTLAEDDLAMGLAVDEARVFVGGGEELQAFSLASGNLLWSVPGYYPRLLYVDDLLYATRDQPGNVFALSPDNGRVLWSVPTKDQFGGAQPATDGDLLFIAAGKSVLALDLASGETAWQAKFDKRQIGTIGVDDNGHLYTSEVGGRIHRLRADSGRPDRAFSWSPARSPVRNQPSGRNVSAPRVENSLLYAASDDGLLAFSLTSASTRPVWQRKDLDVLESTVAVAHGLVYVVTSDGALHAVDAATGQGRR